MRINMCKYCWGRPYYSIEFWNIYILVNKSRGILSLELNLHLEFLKITYSMYFTKCTYQAIMTFYSLCAEHPMNKITIFSVASWEAKCKHSHDSMGEGLYQLWNILLGVLGNTSLCHSTRDKWREGRVKRDQQRAGRKREGEGETVLALLALLILDYVIFKIGMNSNLIVQKYILHLE